MAAPDTLDARFAAAMGQLLGPDFPPALGLAVSGGGDSMAMLALAHAWARVWGTQLHVVTVDHGLRSESAGEAAMVAQECAALGLPHEILRWHWDGQGNVMDAARRARLRLIGTWARHLRHVLTAHTADDVAETFLMRLARGSGVDGLAAMRARRAVPEGFEIVRPCLGMRRDELRRHARGLHMPWVEDPTNDDPKYDRTRARQMLAPLAQLGLEADDLIATAQRLQRASAALRARMHDVAAQVVRAHPSGTLIFDRDRFAQVERETQLRLLAAAVMWVSGATYRPRLSALEDALDAALSGGVRTLSGAQIAPKGAALFVFRELASVRAARDERGLWDGRWRISGAFSEISALGEEIRAVQNWRDAGVPRAALMAMPAVLDAKGGLITPITGVNPACQMIIDSSFTEFLLSH